MRRLCLLLLIGVLALTSCAPGDWPDAVYLTDANVDNLSIDGTALPPANGDATTYLDGTYHFTTPPSTTVTSGDTPSQAPYTDEQAQDTVAVMVQNGTGITWSYDDTANTLTPAVTVTQYTDEMAQDSLGLLAGDTATVNLTYDDNTGIISADAVSEGIQDIVGAMDGGTETGISVAYNDGTGMLDYAVSITQYTAELAQDDVGGMIADTVTVDLTYTDGTPELKADLVTEGVEDIVGAMFDGTESGITATYNDGTGNIDLTVSGGSPTGVFSDLQISVLQADGNLAEASGVQTWAGSDRTSQDVFTLVANKTYRVKGRWIINTGTTSHTTAIAWSTGATITDFQNLVMYWTAAVNAIATAQSTTHVSGVASKVISAATTVAYTILSFEGIMVVGNTGGAITPQINFSANPAGTCLMKRGSWTSFELLGADTVTVLGGWG